MSPGPNPAGYSGTPLPKKLGIRPGSRVLLAGAPAGFEGTLGALPEGARLLGPSAKGADVTLVFAERAAHLAPAFARLSERMATDGCLWVAWPKKAAQKTAGRASDLSFDAVQEIGLAAGLVDAKICAVDATWSGLKFVIRRADRAKRVTPAARKRPSRKA